MVQLCKILSMPGQLLNYIKNVSKVVFTNLLCLGDIFKDKNKILK